MPSFGTITSASTGITSASTCIWTGWVTNITTVTNSTTTWTIWNGISGTAQQQYANPLVGPPRSEAEIADMERRAAEAYQRVEEAQKKRKEVEEKAKTLLHENLTDTQRGALSKHGWFLVEGGKSKKTYRIHSHSSAGNIRELSMGGEEVASYCVHTSDYTVPLNDNLLAQKLGLEFDEDHIIKTANRRQLMAA